MLLGLARNLAWFGPIWPTLAKSIVFKIETWFSHQKYIFESYEWKSSQTLKMLLRLAKNLAQIWDIWPNIAKSIVFKIETWYSHLMYIFESCLQISSQNLKMLPCLATDLAHLAKFGQIYSFQDRDLIFAPNVHFRKPLTNLKSEFDNFALFLAHFA